MTLRNGLAVMLSGKDWVKWKQIRKKSMLGRMNNLVMKEVFNVLRCTVSEKEIGSWRWYWKCNKYEVAKDHLKNPNGRGVTAERKDGTGRDIESESRSVTAVARTESARATGCRTLPLQQIVTCTTRTDARANVYYRTCRQCSILLLLPLIHHRIAG